MKKYFQSNMGRSEEKSTLDHCKKVIHHLLPGASIILYGSRSREEASSTSDYDLTILVKEKVSPELEEKVGNALYEVELQRGVIISDLIFNRNAWDQPLRKAMPLHQNIQREGVLL